MIFGLRRAKMLG